MAKNKEQNIKTPKEKTNKKKLSSFVTFPLVLGVTCLVCGGAVSGVYYFTKENINSNIARANAQGLIDMMEDTVDKMTENSVKDKTIIQNSIDFTLKEGTKYYDVLNNNSPRYYVLKTSKGFKGSMNIGAIVYIENDKAVVYDMKVTANIDEDSLGYGQFSGDSFDFKPGYDGTGNVMDNISGATTSITGNSVGTALKAALDDYSGKNEEPSEPETPTNLKDGTYTVTNAGSGFGQLSGTVEIKDNKIINFEITEHNEMLFNGLLDGTYNGSQDYYNKFIKPIKNGGLSAEVFTNYSSENDKISDATQFSDGFIAFIKDAIAQASK